VTTKELSMPQIDVTQPDPANVPPYQGRSKGFDDDDVGEALGDTVERQLDQTKTGRPGATASLADESPVRSGEVARGTGGSGQQSATNADASTPGGVGASVTRRGENVVREEGEEGRRTTGTQGQSQRPVGTSTSRDSTGIDPQEPAGS